MIQRTEGRTDRGRGWTVVVDRQAGWRREEDRSQNDSSSSSERKEGRKKEEGRERERVEGLPPRLRAR